MIYLEEWCILITVLKWGNGDLVTVNDNIKTRTRVGDNQ